MKNQYFSLISFILTILIAFLFNYPILSQNPRQSVINVSNITSWVSEEGFHDWVVSKMWNGAYPIGSLNGVIFSEGICWGGLVYDGHSPVVRVNGNIYRTGCSPITRLFRVRYDYFTADLTDDAASFFNKNKNDVTDEDIKAIKDQYEKDWNEWPADKGAPYFDEDKNGRYNPDVDVPGVPMALQTIFINYNDDSSYALFNSPPIGLEVQETYWAYTNQDPLGNVIYKKVDLIYKGTSASSPDSRIDSMYITQWSDPDIFSAYNDLAGCDTTLNLGYVYNDPYETVIYPPPYHQSAGYTFLQGVTKFTGNNSDSAVFNFKWRNGYKHINNKPLAGFSYDQPWDVEDIYFNDYSWTLRVFNIMRGYLPVPSYPYSKLYPSTIADYTNNGTYLVTGDPLTGTGKIDGIVDKPGDRRIWLMSGPFSLNLSDTVEVVIALVGGMGDDDLTSIAQLKNNTRAATLFYNYFVEDITAGTVDVPPPDRPKSNVLPDNYVLYQNYPNPFNSITRIKYDLPEDAFVNLTVYDVLGNKVKVLVNENQPAGKYNIPFDAGDLSSGVYFYRIMFNNLSNKQVFDELNKTMKLVLIK